MSNVPVDEALAELGAEPLDGSGFESEEPEADEAVTGSAQEVTE